MSICCSNVGVIAFHISEGGQSTSTIRFIDTNYDTADPRHATLLELAAFYEPVTLSWSGAYLLAWTRTGNVVIIDYYHVCNDIVSLMISVEKSTTQEDWQTYHYRSMGSSRSVWDFARLSCLYYPSQGWYGPLV